jgi:hypothetical protein
MRLDKHFAEFRSELAKCKGYLSPELMLLFKNLSREIKQDKVPSQAQQQVIEELGAYLEALNSDWPIVFGPQRYYEATGGQNDDNVAEDMLGQPGRWARHLRSRMRMPVRFSYQAELMPENKLAIEKEAMQRCYNAVVLAHSYEDLAEKLSLLPEALLALKLDWSNNFAPELRRPAKSKGDFDTRQKPRLLDLSRFTKLRVLKLSSKVAGPLSLTRDTSYGFADRRSEYYSMECLFNQINLPTSLEVLIMRPPARRLSLLAYSDGALDVDGVGLTNKELGQCYRTWLSCFDGVVMDNLVLYEGDPFLFKMPNIKGILALDDDMYRTSAQLRIVPDKEAPDELKAVLNVPSYFVSLDGERVFRYLNPTVDQVVFSQNRSEFGGLKGGILHGSENWWNTHATKWYIAPKKVDNAQQNQEQAVRHR